CPKDLSAKEPKMLRYEIFLNYTSTLQKKATHLCLDMLLCQSSHRLDIYIA
ncbi:hypothetical protein BgiMline_010058, partial [Biomphalaria glabrata]